jgi:hypothetical protein
MEHAVPNNMERARVHNLVLPFMEDLRNWRIEVRRLLDRTRASQEAHVLDFALVNEVEIAREGLDWEVEAFDAVALDLGDDAPPELQIDELGKALHSLQRAAELLADVVDEMNVGPGTVIENETAA